MIKIFIILGVILILLFGLFQYNHNKINKSNMKITSPEFVEGGNIPNKYSCHGDNINPPLVFSDVPENAVTLALVVDDPDAPMGVWDHFVQFNIPPNIREVPENASLEGVKGKNSSGNLKYDGPCPPSGTHRYRFFLYALDSQIDLPEGASKDELLKAFEGHILDQAILVGKFSAQN